ncbi:MAG: glutamate--tRNA ligase [Parcubacteria group bacterium RIFCSPLOWO2_01_FULL_48_18]|nr:MAG: glutamate--tRNA ligase [Parcubacteria group bacterium RIFCSPLOWO2_01_FULL_48_18]OHB23541.1 MAG: glutamate--tRNA ligase [Parcubacteria group bacterium RIFCSPHIGHO2_02_FULL_48_10b]
MKQEIRTRFAPSPTGPLHLGGARTAIFNWLFAKKMGGAFILRIEDTDAERSDVRFERDIMENLRWLRIFWDEGPILETELLKSEPIRSEIFESEPQSRGPHGRKPQSRGQVEGKPKTKNYIGNFGPYRQTERTERYAYFMDTLFEKDLAYYCFCSKEELEMRRQEMLLGGEAPRYSGKCRDIRIKEARERKKRGESCIIRFKVPEKKVTFKDIIRGDISFNSALVGDIAIAKDERMPLYNFSVVVDDFEMQISHVIRGEEHLPNTPKQILIQQALKMPMPAYAHLPLILAPDKSKMSKRVGLFNIADYREQGYLPEAVLNFLVLLGWHPEDNQEMFAADGLVEKFSLERIQKAGAIFNAQKFDWINGEYIRKLNNAALLEYLRPLIEKREWLKDDAFHLKVIAIEKERIKRLSDFLEMAGFFYQLPEYGSKMLQWKNTPADETAANLRLTVEELEKVSETEFIKGRLERILVPLAEETGRGELYWPLRVSLSGKEASPGPFEIMEILGKEESTRRIRIALEKL